MKPWLLLGLLWLAGCDATWQRLGDGGKPVKISNGEPDMAKPGFVVPAGVTMVILIGDGDSEKFATRMRLQTGALRLRNLGIEAYVSMAADGLDFSDMLRRRADSARDAGDAEGIAA